MNLVAEASESLYIFQPGGYFVRTNTSAAGMYAARLSESFAAASQAKHESIFGYLLELMKSCKDMRSPTNMIHRGKGYPNPSYL